MPVVTHACFINIFNISRTACNNLGYECLTRYSSYPTSLMYLLCRPFDFPCMFIDFEQSP